MRRLQTVSENRIALAALQASEGYVSALLGLARDQIVARQGLFLGEASWTDRTLASRTGAIASQTKWH
jgi:hypothetical protein